jgi:hypothetical protein
MNELIQQLMSKAGLTEAQAVQATSVTRDFLKTKLPPQMTGMVDNFFAGNFDAAAAAAPSGAKSDDWMNKAKEAAADAGDKLGDFAAKAKDKAEDFAEDAARKAGEWAHKAEDFAEDAMDKLKDMFGSKKGEPKQ